MKHYDKILFEKWKSEDLVNLKSNFERLEKIASGHSELLGCYLWDFGNEAPMPLDRMKRQMEYGYQLLKAGRIEGLIFLEHGVCDINLETVKWTKEWFPQVGARLIH